MTDGELNRMVESSLRARARIQEQARRTGRTRELVEKNWVELPPTDLDWRVERNRELLRQLKAATRSLRESAGLPPEDV